MKSRARYPGITRLGDGTYRIRVQLRATPGRPRKEVDRIISCTDIRGAMAKREEMLFELVHGTHRAEEITLRAFARLWLESKALRLAHSTADRYASALDLHILPDLGDYAVSALTYRDIESWMVAKAKQLQPATVNGLLGVLQAVVGAACREYKLADPSADVAVLPTERPEDDPNALTEKELSALLGAFHQKEPQHYPLVLTLALTGLRWGEASALKWDDLDREAGIIRVRRAHWHGRVKTTKTKRPRTAPLPPPLLAVLDAWRAELVRKQHEGLAEGWCFPSRTGGLRFGSSMTKPMRRCLKAAQITKRVSVQGLRRSVEDALRRLNVAGPVAEALMGHNSRMRFHYSTVAPSEVASVGLRLVEAVGLGAFVGDRVGDQAADAKTPDQLSGANRASVLVNPGAGDGI